MPENISYPQLCLLKYLREHTGGSGARISMEPKAVTRGLRISTSQFTIDSDGLVAHGLVGVRYFWSDAKNAPSSSCSAIWLTGKGEEHLRRSHSAMPMAKPADRG